MSSSNPLHLYDLVSEDDYRTAVENRLINVRESGTGLYIHNYSDLAMFTSGAWDNPAVRVCRGLITDEDGTVVARPWRKFYNWNQNEAGELDLISPVEVTDKKDGSLAISYLAADGLHSIASRGSFLSDQALHATEVLRTNYTGVNFPEGKTFLFEIIYPANRIVLSYTFDDLVLLGAVDIETGAYHGPLEAKDMLQWPGPVTEVFQYQTLKEALEAPPRPNAEGLCVRYLNRPHILKIKQEDYLKAHAYLTNCTPLQIWRKVGEGYILEDFLQEAPDEFVPLVTQYYTELVANMEDIRRRVNSEWELLQQSLPEDHSRKQLADAAKGNPYSPALFMLADGKDLEPYLLKKVKPSALP